MVRSLKPASIPDNQLKMRYVFNRLMGVPMCHILPRVRKDGTIWLEELPAFAQLLDTAFGDPEWMATTEQDRRDITQYNLEFSQYYAEFHVVAADLDWNSSPLQNLHCMRLTEEMDDSCTYSGIPKEHPAIVTVCPKRDNQIRK